jgi:hypothetical protein
VSGVDDVAFQVPESADIEDTLTAQVPEVVEDALRDVDPEDILEDSLEVGQDPGELAGELATELPEQLEQVDVDVEAGLFGPTEEDLEGIISGTLEPPEPVGEARSLSFFELSSIVVNGEAQQGVTPSEAQAELDRREQEVREAETEDGRELFEVTALNPLTAIQQLATDLREVITDLTQTVGEIAEIFTEDVIDFLTAPVDALEEALENAFPTIDGASFLGDPVTFLGGAITAGVTAATPQDDLEDLESVLDELEGMDSGGSDG